MWNATTDGPGAYSQGGRTPDFGRTMPPNTRFYKGWFNETIPPFLAARPRAPVAAVHIDCDLYSCSLDVLEALASRLQPGATVRFDEYYLLRPSADFPREMYDQHEARAWTEVVERYAIEAERLSWFGQAVTFRVTANPAFDAGQFGGVEEDGLHDEL